MLVIRGINMSFALVREPESGFRIPGFSADSWKLLLVDSGSWALSPGVQIKETGIPLTITIRNPRHGIQGPRLSCIPIHVTRICMQ